MHHHRETSTDPTNPPPLTKPEALESALSAPTEGFGEEDSYKGLLSKASALSFRLASEHPFQDGNKRAAFAVLTETLRINGFPLDWTKQTAIIVISLAGANHIDAEGMLHAVAFGCGFHPADILP
jgi:prophage maintenance system killer protein